MQPKLVIYDHNYRRYCNFGGDLLYYAVKKITHRGVDMEKRTWKQWLWYFSLVAALILFFKLADGRVLAAAVDILAPFIGALALAFLLLAPCRWIEDKLVALRGRAWRVLARPVAITAVYLAAVGIIALLISLIIPQLVGSVAELIAALPEYIQQLQGFFESGVLAALGLGDSLDSLYELATGLISTTVTGDTVMSALRGVLDVTSSVLDVIITLIVSIYMLASREQLTRAVRSFCGLFLKDAHIDLLGGYTRRVGDIFYKYLYGSLIDALAVGVVVSIGLLILRVPYAILLGMGLGLLNMIPYFGAIAGGAIISVITLLSNGLYAALGVLVFIIVVQQLDSNILQPRVVGDSVGLRPIYVLFGITLFGGLLGFWGILLGVPIMATIQMILRDIIANKRKKAATE